MLVSPPSSYPSVNAGFGVLKTSISLPFLLRFLLLFSVAIGQTPELFVDINPTGSSVQGTELIVFQDKIFFRANDGVHGTELWSTDGTVEGTAMLIDIDTRSVNGVGLSSNPTQFFKTSDDAFLYFRTSLFEDAGVWVTDGTELGTRLVGRSIRNFVDPIEYKGDVYVSFDKVLYKIARDSSSDEAEVVKSFRFGPNSMFVYNDLLHFTARGNETDLGSELWVSDGTTAGTVLQQDIYPGSNSSSPSFRFEFEGNPYLLLGPILEKELWRLDGTTASRVPGTEELEFGCCFQEYAGAVYFSTRPLGPSRPFRYELWKMDFLPDGSVSASQVSEPDFAWTDSTFTSRTVFNEKLYFSAGNAENGVELWVYDAATDEYELFMDFVPGFEDSYPDFMLTFEGLLYMKVKLDPQNSLDTDIWVTDGTKENTRQVTEGFNALWDAVEFNGALYFPLEGSDPVQGTDVELWRIVGTTSSNTSPTTSPVAVQAASSSPSEDPSEAPSNNSPTTSPVAVQAASSSPSEAPSSRPISESTSSCMMLGISVAWTCCITIAGFTLLLL